MLKKEITKDRESKKLERHTIYVDWKTPHSKDVLFLLNDIQVNAIPIEIPARCFVAVDQIILKFLRKSKGTKIAVLVSCGCCNNLLQTVA